MDFQQAAPRFTYRRERQSSPNGKQHWAVSLLNLHAERLAGHWRRVGHSRWGVWARVPPRRRRGERWNEDLRGLIRYVYMATHYARKYTSNLLIYVLDPTPVDDTYEKKEERDELVSLRSRKSSRSSLPRMYALIVPSKGSFGRCARFWEGETLQIPNPKVRIVCLLSRGRTDRSFVVVDENGDSPRWARLIADPHTGHIVAGRSLSIPFRVPSTDRVLQARVLTTMPTRLRRIPKTIKISGSDLGTLALQPVSSQFQTARFLPGSVNDFTADSLEPLVLRNIFLSTW